MSVSAEKLMDKNLIGLLPDCESETKKLFKQIGPGLIWSASAIGTGELIFSTRTASLYGLALAWVIFISIFSKFFITYEVGRYTTITGQPILAGIGQFSKPLVVFLAFVPISWQAVTAAGFPITIGTLLQFAAGGFGTPVGWAVVTIVVTAIILWIGKYGWLETLCTWCMVLITGGVVISAVMFTPASAYLEIIKCTLIPTIPEGKNVWTDIMSMVGFLGAGCIGTIWYSYWVKEKGYGMSQVNNKTDENGNTVMMLPSESSEEVAKGKNWFKLLTLDMGFSTVLTYLVCVAFFFCGFSILRPRGLAPEGIKLALVQSEIMIQLLGPLGMWVYLLGAFAAVFSTFITMTDGWARVWEDAAKIVWPNAKLAQKYSYKKRYNIAVGFYIFLCFFSLIFILLKVQPLFLIQGQAILDGAFSLPILAIATIKLNKKYLPKSYQPGSAAVALNWMGIVIFLAFAIFYTGQTLKLF